MATPAPSRSRSSRPGPALWWTGACVAAALGAAGLALLPEPREPAGLARLAAVALAGNVVLFAAAVLQRRLALRLRADAERGGRAAAAAAEESTARERELREAERSAFLAVADDLRSLALDQQRGLDRMQRSHDDPETLDGLMRADHAATQLAHRAEKLLVLGGTLPQPRVGGPVPLLDIVRGAQSRIPHYQRVQIHGDLSRGAALAAAPGAAEPLVHAVAELLDNATRYSPADRGVVVTVTTVQDSALIEVDDAGPGLSPRDLHEARARLAGPDPLPLPCLTGPRPQLGLPAVGRLARAYGFAVTLATPSTYGGVRASVTIPHPLLSGPLTAPMGAPARH
ncbi:hypothetical protein GCM10027168_05930 [Streptomyces capparidis]